jgi:hypothetical protein
MIDLRLKSFAAPDQTIELPLLRAEIVELGDFTVGHVVFEAQQPPRSLGG